MARIRTVKPDLFRHEDLFEAELRFKLPLRLAYIGLFSVCDREGRFRWRPRQLQLDILPYDDTDFSLVLDGLEQAGFIKSYEIDGNRYGYIPSWHKHQVINQREAASSLPSPDVINEAETTTRVQVNKTPYAQNDIESSAMSGVNPSLLADIHHINDEASVEFQFDETDIAVEPDNNAFNDTEDAPNDLAQPIFTGSDKSFNKEDNTNTSSLELEQQPQIVTESFGDASYGPFSLTVSVNNNILHQTEYTEIYIAAETNSTSINSAPVVNQINPSSSESIKASAVNQDLTSRHEFINARAESDLILSNQCMHVHAHACTWGIGREKERELEWEEEQEREGEVRRGREICAKQTYPPRLSDIVAQARRRSGDPPGELSANQTRSSQLSRELVTKNFGYWKLPLGDPQAKWDSARKNIPLSLADIVTRARQGSTDPPGRLCTNQSAKSNQRQVIMENFERSWCHEDTGDLVDH